MAGTDDQTSQVGAARSGLGGTTGGTDGAETLQLDIAAEVMLEQDGLRLDQAAAACFPDYSRARLQAWIKAGALKIDGRQAAVRQKVDAGQRLSIQTTLDTDRAWIAEDIALQFVYRDEHIAVVCKPAGLVTHPGAGNPRGTLANAMLHHCPEVGTIPRAGIVHRLDKDTSGLLVVALSLPAHASLVGQLQDRSVSREYLALVRGRPPASGTIDKPIGRHRQQRQKMAVLPNGGKQAITSFTALEYYDDLALLRLKLETGRTHQIRVHMAELGYALLGDPVYGSKRALRKTVAAEIRAAAAAFPRQALHAERLALRHPVTGDSLQWQADLPADMAAMLSLLRSNSAR